MSDKSTILRSFNTLFFDFLKEIIDNVEENGDIITAKSYFEKIKKMNPTILIKVWFSFILSPYKDIIESGNIDFIFEKDYRNDLSNINNSEEIMKSIDKIREPIRQLNDVNKENTMKYIKNLSRLSDMYNKI
jgi:hypothetical protein